MYNSKVGLHVAKMINVHHASIIILTNAYSIVCNALFPLTDEVLLFNS